MIAMTATAAVMMTMMMVTRVFHAGSNP